MLGYFTTRLLSLMIETQLSLTNHATHLYKCNGMADLKHAAPHVLLC